MSRGAQQRALFAALDVRFDQCYRLGYVKIQSDGLDAFRAGIRKRVRGTSSGAQVKAHFRPEFINRIDEIVVFNALDNEAIRRIAKIQIDKLAARVEAQDLHLEVTDAALSAVARAGFDPLYGARPLKRAVQEYIENRVARMLLEGKCMPKDAIVVDADENGNFSFSTRKPN